MVLKYRGEVEQMKKYFAGFLMFALVAVMVPMMTVSTNAQTRRYRENRSYSRSYERPNFYKRHRNLINIGIGTAAGAIVGGLIGGKKGALWGTAIGAGGSAIYTYKINPKTRRYERFYYRR